MTPLAALLAEVRGLAASIPVPLANAIWSAAKEASDTKGADAVLVAAINVWPSLFARLLALAEPTVRAEDGSEVQRAVEAEREACARIAETWGYDHANSVRKSHPRRIVRRNAAKWHRAYQDECDTSTRLRAALAQARADGRNDAINERVQRLAHPDAQARGAGEAR